MVKITLAPRLARVAGTDSLEISITSFETLLNVLRRLSRQFGEEYQGVIFDPGTDRLSQDIVIMINGVNIRRSRVFGLDLRTKMNCTF